MGWSLVARIWDLTAMVSRKVSQAKVAGVVGAVLVVSAGVDARAVLVGSAAAVVAAVVAAESAVSSEIAAALAGAVAAMAQAMTLGLVVPVGASAGRSERRARRRVAWG
jgi:hypothetical protein